MSFTLKLVAPHRRDLLGGGAGRGPAVDRRVDDQVQFGLAEDAVVDDGRLVAGRVGVGAGSPVGACSSPPVPSPVLLVPPSSAGGGRRRVTPTSSGEGRVGAGTLAVLSEPAAKHGVVADEPVGARAGRIVVAGDVEIGLDGPRSNCSSRRNC